MSKTKRALLALTIISGFATPTWAAETTKPSCTDVIRACDAAIAELGKSIDYKNEVIDELSRQIRLAEQVARDAKDEANAWYRNPLIIGTLGFTAGVLGGVWAAKR